MKNLNPDGDTTELLTLPEIGASLRSLRLEKGLSLDAIADRTMIAKRILIAIEKGDINLLPEPFYTKALIIKYAKSLGIENPSQYTNIFDLKNKSQSKFNWHFPSFNLNPIHLYILYIAVIGISIKAITANIIETTVNVAEQETLSESNSDNNKSTIKDIASIDNSIVQPQLVSQSNSSNLNEVTVDVNLKDRCWMKVIVDGKIIFEGTLPPGTHRSFRGKEQVTIVAGNAGGVVVTYNHGKEKLLGKPGQVQEVTYTVN